MTFSFYSSVRSLPHQLDELSRMLRLTRWQRFWKIEVPSATIGLVWNGMMSFGGGWFFLAAAEAISVLNHQYQLPGVGSFVAAAIAKQELGKVGYGILTMVVLVVAVNVLFWRPLIAWSEKYKLEESEAAERPRSIVLDLLRRSAWPRALGRLRRRAAEPLDRLMTVLGRDGLRPPAATTAPRLNDRLFDAAVVAAIGYGVYRMGVYIQQTVGLDEVAKAFLYGLATMGRVVVLLTLGTVIWVPVGVWIGMSTRVTRLAQPIVQVLASFPANFLFPFATLAFIWLGVSLNFGAILLMSLGAQWYILFNVIAGAQAIPTDLREAAATLRLNRWQRWRSLILPAIFPSYVTGGITAAGGAWNASIVAEVVSYGPTTLTATGLGAYIAHATEVGDFPRILIGVAVMSTFVVGVNRLLWRRLYRLAETRYSL